MKTPERLHRQTCLVLLQMLASNCVLGCEMIVAPRGRINQDTIVIQYDQLKDLGY